MTNTFYIYILTNQSFPDLVKIGYTSDIERRLKSLNSSEAVPFAFRLYAYYEASERLSDVKVHDMIDKINPSLRSVDNLNGKKRTREFYKMTKENAYNVLDCIAYCSGTEDKLHLMEDFDEKVTKEEAESIDKTKYDKKDLLLDKKPEIISLHNLVFKSVKERLPGVFEETTPNYIALRNEKKKNICEFHFYKSCLLIQTRIPTRSDLQIGEKVPDTYLWALNYKVRISSKEEVEKAVDILVDVYNQIKK